MTLDTDNSPVQLRQLKQQQQLQPKSDQEDDDWGGEAKQINTKSKLPINKSFVCSDVLSTGAPSVTAAAAAAAFHFSFNCHCSHEDKTSIVQTSFFTFIILPLALLKVLAHFVLLFCFHRSTFNFSVSASWLIFFFFLPLFLPLFLSFLSPCPN